MDQWLRKLIEKKKNTNASSRVPKFKSQQSHSGSQPLLTPFQGDMMSSYGLHGHKYT